VLTWRAPIEGTPHRYAIAGGDSSGPSSLPVVLTDGARTTYTIPGLPSGTYRFRVHAVGSSGLSPASPDARVVTDGGVAAIPGPPTGLQASIEALDLTLTWLPPAIGAPPSAYVVEFETLPGHHDTATVPGISRSFTRRVASGLRWATVRATTGGSISGSSNGVGASLGGDTCTGAPGAPVFLPGTAVGRLRIFSWLPASGPPATHFRIDVSIESDASPVATLTTPGPGTSFVWTGPSGGIAARVVAVNACGASAPSNQVIVAALP
jgi:hypothetical protein